MEPQQPIYFPIPPPPSKKSRRPSAIIVITLLLVGLLIGGIVTYAATYWDFNNKLNNIEAQVGLYGGTNSASPIVLSDNASLSTLYQQVKTAVVVITDLVPSYTLFGGQVYTLQQGSGFITPVNNQMVIVTNNHVVDGAINVTATFADGDSYPATVLGQDAKADLAVLQVSSIPSSATSLALVNSDSLQVGDPVIAVGSPYGLSGTLTTGVISALGRTITEDSSSNQNGQDIPNTIQTSTPINAGNSGGPLLTEAGQVVGITTAGISNSQGLGFAIPSSTIMRELVTLVNTGSYDQHPSINAIGVDMNYQIAQAMNAPVTYGWLVERVSAQNGLQGGSTQRSILGNNVILGGDIIVGINNVRITNTDDLLAYLEEHTLPGQTVNFTVVRDGQTQTVAVTIGKA